jgi:hypothetical protein
LNQSFSGLQKSMVKIVQRRRGRPPGSTTVPRDLLAEIWVQVLITRIEARRRTGKTPSVRKACQEIADKGGIISAVGGRLDALVAANAASKKKRRQRFRFNSEGGVSPNATGSIFADHAISNADTLHVRYTWANEIATSPRVRLVWMDLARQILGLPTKRRVQPLMRRMSRGPV